jgi:ribosomal protein L37AE/L43A
VDQRLYLPPRDFSEQGLFVEFLVHHRIRPQLHAIHQCTEYGACSVVRYMAERNSERRGALLAYTETSFPDVPAHTDSRHQSVDLFDGGCRVLRIVPKLDVGPPASRTSANVVRETSEQLQLLDRVACPLCHTEISNASALFPWQCQRCGQQWSPRRVATVAAYATWVKARGAISLKPPDEASVTNGDLLQPLLVAVHRT